MIKKIRNPKHEIRNDDGVIFITTLLFVLAIGILSTSLFAWTISERRLVEMSTNRILAFHLADSGIDEAMVQLSSDANYAGTNGTVALGSGAYSTVVTKPDPLLNSQVRKIISTGYTPNNQNNSYAYQERTVNTYVFLQPKPLFNNAVFAENKISMNGNTKNQTDSYNSTLGPYGGVNVGINGDIASNTTLAGNINLTGSIIIGGDVIVGPSGNPTDVINASTNVTIKGTQLISPTTQEYDPVTVPAGLTSSGNLNLSGDQTMTLASGTYLFDSISISGQSKLNVQGAVTIYVNGDVDITGGGVATADNIPSNLIVNVAGTNDVEISGNGTFYGVIYSPESGIVKVNGNVDVFGAIVAYNFDSSGNAKIHYDEALALLTSASKSTVSLISWEEN